MVSLPRKNSSDHIKSREAANKIELLLEKAKLRQEGHSKKLIEQKNEERINKLINSNKKLALKLGEKNSLIPHNLPKSKLFGD